MPIQTAQNYECKCFRRARPTSFLVHLAGWRLPCAGRQPAVRACAQGPLTCCVARLSQGSSPGLRFHQPHGWRGTVNTG